MQTRVFKACLAAAIVMVFSSSLQISAQNGKPLSLDDAENLAVKNNHLVKVRRLQIDEKQQKVNEDRIKYLPTIVAGGAYQYNTGLPSITIDKGVFGELPLGTTKIPFPPIDEVLQMGNHDNYNAGISVYQPVTQMGKINAGVQVSKSEYRIAQTEESKAEFQVRQTVEKLYFGLLILQKQIEEANLKVTLAKTKLSDVENAFSAGKTTESNKFGLSAAEADEEQNLLKLQIQYDDYASELKQLIGLDETSELVLQPVPSGQIIESAAVIDTALNVASINNDDLRLASLYKTKADNAVRASKYSFLPDVGLLGGYAYQKGTALYPKNNAFVGASIKWNIQDVLSNRTIELQRISAREQAEENMANTKEQVSNDIAKTYRKLKQSEDLIKVAEKVVSYRREDLKMQSDKSSSGLNLEADLLTAKAALARAESDYFSAQLNYRITLSELKILMGIY